MARAPFYSTDFIFQFTLRCLFTGARVSPRIPPQFVARPTRPTISSPVAFHSAENYDRVRAFFDIARRRSVAGNELELSK